MQSVFLLIAICNLYCSEAYGQQKTPDATAGRSIGPDAFRELDGFEVDLVHSVDGEKQGSWVCMCVDLKGRLIVSDQYGKIYRIDNLNGDIRIEALEIDVGMAQGLLHTTDGLYVSINGNMADGSGVYRLQDTNNDDQFDLQEKLIHLNFGGEHGPHAIIPGPDGRLYFCAGNATDLPKLDRSKVPLNWSEDHLLGRMPDGRGFMVNRMAPGGFVLSFQPDGSDVTLESTGFRNEYDIAFNNDGELFTYDADMEWDIGTPWYRATRVNHVISGGEFGWRNGTGKWPDYYPDSFGSVVDVGPGSPTGITFGYETNFPHRYRDALFIGDWSYGVLYAVHLSPSGSSYQGVAEPFLSAAPMPITDVVAHPKDGCLYFLVGGRRVQSALYRVRYTGDINDHTSDSETKPSALNLDLSRQLRGLRHRLEQFHIRAASDSDFDFIHENLNHSDRAIRFAARVALENQPLANWRDAKTQPAEPAVIIQRAIALARSSNSLAEDQKTNLAIQMRTKLSELDYATLSDFQRLDLLRAYQLSFTRFGESSGKPDGDAEGRNAILKQLNLHFPSENENSKLNRELATLLIYLEAPDVVQKCVVRMSVNASFEEQIHYALSLRNVTNGWDEASRRSYFEWFQTTSSARGGASFGGYINNIRKQAIQNLDSQTKETLGELLRPLESSNDLQSELRQRPFVQQWTTSELSERITETSITASFGSPDFELGKRLFTTAQCYKCHRFAGFGGIQGPDLTAAGNRFSIKELLTAIVEPSKEISDQYRRTQFVTEDEIVTGRVANLNGEKMQIVTNMLDPGNFTDLRRDEVIEMRPSTVSSMPSGLLDTFEPEEIAQLINYIRSGGDATHPIYSQQ